MAIMKKNKDMKRGYIHFQYTNNIAAVKWFDNCDLILLGTSWKGVIKFQLLLAELKDQAQKYLSHALFLWRITILGWAVLTY